MMKAATVVGASSGKKVKTMSPRFVTMRACRVLAWAVKLMISWVVGGSLVGMQRDFGAALPVPPRAADD